MWFHGLILGIVTSAVTFAQWPPYPTPGVPRTADGKPNLEGPTPRTADGHPDLSGVWEFHNPGSPGRGTGGTAVSATRGVGGVGITPAPVNQFWNIGSSLKGGLPFQPLAAELRKARIAEGSKDNPDAMCLPLGLMQLHTHPQPRKIIQIPGLIVILYEANSGTRQIFTDGRPLPKTDLQPWWFGYSVGHWEADTLVVETFGFRDDVWLDVEGSPLTNAGKMIERFRRLDFGHLEIDVTVDDSKSYTRPWTVKIEQRIMLDTDLIEFICNENDRSRVHMVGN
jgi:hypothetical protein